MSEQHAATAAAFMLLLVQMMSEKTLRRPSRSVTMESISPEDFPRQGDVPALLCHHIHWLPADSTSVCVSVEFLEAVRQQVQKFQVLYVGTLPVSRAMGR